MTNTKMITLQISEDQGKQLSVLIDQEIGWISETQGNQNIEVVRLKNLHSIILASIDLANKPKRYSID